MDVIISTLPLEQVTDHLLCNCETTEPVIYSTMPSPITRNLQGTS